jgi:hypothetical protein
MRTYVTFGFDHRHEIDGIVFDRNCVAIIDGPDPETNRETAFKIFGRKFCFEYPEEFWSEDKMKFFPNGYVEVKNGN